MAPRRGRGGGKTADRGRGGRKPRLEGVASLEAPEGFTEGHSRELAIATIAVMQRLGEPAALVDEADLMVPVRMARAPGFALVEYPHDKARSRFRRIEVFAVEGEGALRGDAPVVIEESGKPIEGAKLFALDPERRLFCYTTTHFATPPGWKLILCRPPGEWFNVALLTLSAAVLGTADTLDRRMTAMMG